MGTSTFQASKWQGAEGRSLDGSDTRLNSKPRPAGKSFIQSTKAELSPSSATERESITASRFATPEPNHKPIRSSSGHSLQASMTRMLLPTRPLRRAPAPRSVRTTFFRTLAAALTTLPRRSSAPASIAVALPSG